MKAIKLLNNNIILFPKTVEYYQFQLTRLLETESYAEASELLSFLLSCQADDNQTYEEWKSLLEFLHTSFSTELELEQEYEYSEDDFIKQRVKEKLEEDQHYAKKMLDTLLQNPAMEKKMLALEQLSFLEHPQINETLKRWIENVDLHPLVQFKVLQTMKSRKVQGNTTMAKCGEEVKVDIQLTPLSFEEFPLPMQQILQRVRDISEVNHPALTYFSEQTWKEFLSYVYGTSLYQMLAETGETECNLWAAALYHVVIQTMLGTANENETKELYGIGKEMLFRWEQAVRYISNFVESAYRSH